MTINEYSTIDEMKDLIREHRDEIKESRIPTKKSEIWTLIRKYDLHKLKRPIQTKTPIKTPKKSPKKSPNKSPKKSPKKSPNKSPKKSLKKSPKKVLRSKSIPTPISNKKETIVKSKIFGSVSPSRLSKQSRNIEPPTHMLASEQKACPRVCTPKTVAESERIFDKICKQYPYNIYCLRNVAANNSTKATTPTISSRLSLNKATTPTISSRLSSNKTTTPTISSRLSSNKTTTPTISSRLSSKNANASGGEHLNIPNFGIIVDDNGNGIAVTDKTGNIELLPKPIEASIVNIADEAGTVPIVQVLPIDDEDIPEIVGDFKPITAAHNNDLLGDIRKGLALKKNNAVSKCGVGFYWSNSLKACVALKGNEKQQQQLVNILGNALAGRREAIGSSNDSRLSSRSSYKWDD